MSSETLTPAVRRTRYKPNQSTIVFGIAVLLVLVLSAALSGFNPATVEWWERHDTDPTRGRTKRIRLDTGQVIQLRQLVLSVAEEPDIRVISYFADVDGDLDDIEFDA